MSGWGLWLAGGLIGAWVIFLVGYALGGPCDGPGLSGETAGDAMTKSRSRAAERSRLSEAREDREPRNEL